MAQIAIICPVVGWAGKNRKEIELSVQKTKIGILPTRNSAFETGFGLRFQTAWWMPELPVFAPWVLFAIVQIL